MVRPRQHNLAKVREATYRCFWERGYSQTSMSDLHRSTGLDPRQFFRDYGNKQGVFIQALHDFSDAAAQYTLHRLENGSDGIADIKWTLNCLIGLSGEEAHWGCLICSTAQDKEAMSYPAVVRLVEAYFRRIETSDWSALARAVDSREVQMGNARRRRLARSLMATHIAIMTLRRSRMSHETLKDIAKQAVDSVR